MCQMRIHTTPTCIVSSQSKWPDLNWLSWYRMDSLGTILYTILHFPLIVFEPFLLLLLKMLPLKRSSGHLSLVTWQPLLVHLQLQLPLCFLLVESKKTRKVRVDTSLNCALPVVSKWKASGVMSCLLLWNCFESFDLITLHLAYVWDLLFFLWRSI